MELTVADLQHFATCPRLYWFTKERSNPYMQWFDHFDRSMHLLWNGMALQSQSEEPSSLQILLKRWGAIYYPQSNKHTIVNRINGAARWHDPDRALFFNGVVSIKSGHEVWQQKLKHVVTVGQEWSMPVGEHVLLGRYDLITQEADQLVLWELRFHTVPQRRSLRMDWEITANVAAFQRDYGRLPDRIRIYEAILGDVYESKRTAADFAVLKDLIAQVADSIERGVAYPAFSYQCEQCPYYQSCFSDYRALAKIKRKG